MQVWGPVEPGQERGLEGVGQLRDRAPPRHPRQLLRKEGDALGAVHDRLHDAVVDTDRGQPAHEVPHLIVRQGFDRKDVDELGDRAVAGCRVGALGEEDQ